mgnify:FL=1
MRYGLSVPNFGEYADPRLTADLAHQAEATGWDGFFVWDHINAAPPGSGMADPWVLLTAAALATERVRIGTMVTPVARRRPWKLARETATLDQLSGGRLILGVGLGYPADLEYAALGEEPDDRLRAEKLDEGLQVLTGLWTGEPFSFDGRHFHIDDAQFLPTPVQRPRIPIWVAQMWPHRRPLKRAARWDGLVPMHETEMFPSPAQVADVVSEVRSSRDPDEPFDVNVPVLLSADRSEAAEQARAFESAGATWLQVGAWTLYEVRGQISAGPPGR